MWEFSQDSVTEQLKIDQALLNVSSTVFNSLWIYQLSDECVAVRVFIQSIYSDTLRELSFSLFV